MVGPDSKDKIFHGQQVNEKKALADRKLLKSSKNQPNLLKIYNFVSFSDVCRPHKFIWQPAIPGLKNGVDVCRIYEFLLERFGDFQSRLKCRSVIFVTDMPR
jgi:hypothetical protein